MILSKRRTRWMRWLLALTFVLTSTAVSGALTAAPAQAATCRTLGHAYLIFNGVHFSGYEGDQRFGVPNVTMARGSRFELGGNGIKPGTPIVFRVEGPGNDETVVGPAGSNCVVNQRAFIQGAQPGQYRLFATYEVPTRLIVDDPVANVTVT